MRAIVTRAKRLSGRLRVPGDKSISHRAVLFGALAKGLTRIEGLGPGADIKTSLQCVETLGVTSRWVDESLLLESPGRSAFRGNATLDCGNSGTTVRLLLGMLAPSVGLSTTLTGDESLSRRPMRRVADPLRRMGANLALTEAGTLPATVRGARLTGVKHVLEVASAQVKSALLLAGLDADGETWVSEPGPSRDHTERLLPIFGGDVRYGPAGIGVTRQSLYGGAVRVPGDPSSAAFLAAAAALVPGSELTLDGVGANPTRTGVVEMLAELGAHVEITDVSTDPEPFGTWVCRPGDLKGVVIEGEVVPRSIDEIPVLAVVATAARGTTIVRDATELRVKESDRLALMARGLRDMGAKVEELPDGLAIEGGAPLHGATIDSGGDHRIAMAFAIAGLIADGETIIEGAEWADISYPGFFQVLAELTGGSVRTEA